MTIVTVTRPILSAEERSKRMNVVIDATTKLIIAIERQNRRKKHEKRKEADQSTEKDACELGNKSV